MDKTSLEKYDSDETLNGSPINYEARALRMGPISSGGKIQKNYDDSKQNSSLSLPVANGIIPLSGDPKVIGLYSIGSAIREGVKNP